MTATLAHRHLDLLHLELQTAIEIEHTTLPPYLTAGFSIHPDTNRDAQANVREVAMQEMLHMTLAANVLNAVGGKPDVSRPEFVPGYPTNLPWHAPGFSVGLERFSRPQIEVFAQIEAPAKECFFHDRPEVQRLAHAGDGRALLDALGPPDDGPPPPIGYQTIGEFYEAVILRLRWVVAKLGEKEVFTGGPERQVQPEHYYGGGGRIIVVKDLVTAVTALLSIVVQGEGTATSVWDGDHERAVPLQPAHFYEYDELLQGRHYKIGDVPLHPTGEPLPVDWDAVYPMRPNPKREEYERAPEIHQKLLAFDELYFQLLRDLDASFNGTPERLREGVARMWELRYRAIDLLRTPDPFHPGVTVGPSWGSLPPGHHPAFDLWTRKHRIFSMYPELGGA